MNLSDEELEKIAFRLYADFVIGGPAYMKFSQDFYNSDDAARVRRIWEREMPNSTKLMWIEVAKRLIA